MFDVLFVYGKSLVIMLFAAAVPLVLYAARSAGKDFTVGCFLATNRTRLVYGFIAMSIVAGLLTLVDGAGAALALVGFAPGGSEVALGFTIGGLLVVAVSGDAPK